MPFRCDWRSVDRNIWWNADMMGKIAAVVIAIGFFGGIILTYLFGYNDKMLDS